MSAAGRFLQQAVQEFENRGITNDIEIAGMIGALLTRQVDWDQQQTYSLSLLNPFNSILTRLGQDGMNAVIAHLRSALAESPFRTDLGNFYQHEIRYELLKNRTPPQYPTPHHVADFMTALAVTNATTSVCDPAAGSGGLLAAALQYRANFQNIVGCDYDPSWMALGHNNLYCHGLNPLNDFTLHEKSGLLLLHDEQRFDCVVMNPPFNGSRSVEEVEETVGRDYGTSLVNVMGALAVQLLTDGGRTAFLMPSGLLFGGGASASLRGLWLQHNLEAIISLDRTCFQPYSSVSGHVILLQKRERDVVEPDTPVWFCDVNRDGYPEGAARDLTIEPKIESNELPRVQELILGNREIEWPYKLALSDTMTIEAILLHPADGVPGVAIRSAQDFEQKNISAWVLPDGYLLRSVEEGTGRPPFLYLPISGSDAIVLDGVTAQTIRWSQVLTMPADMETVSGQWHVEDQDSKVVVTLEAEGRNLRIATGTGSNRKQIDFDTTEEAAISACLLDDNGAPIAPWLSVSEAIADPASLFGNTFGGSPVLNRAGELCAWLYRLTPADEANGENTTDAGFLLVVNSSEVSLSAAGDGDCVFAHLPNGFAALDLPVSSRLQIERGQPVTLPDGNYRGLAFGATTNGTSVFASLVPRHRLRQADEIVLSFESKRFLPQPAQPSVRHPADVIAAIRKHQTNFSLRVDSLLQMMGGKRPLEAEVSPLYVDLLSPRQQEIWRIVEDISADASRQSFALRHLVAQCQASQLAGVTVDEVEKFLELCLALGLVIPIHMADHNLYRAVQPSDYAAPMNSLS